MTDVLISAGELAELVSKEPCVIIDTRNPDAYGAGTPPERRERARDLHLSCDNRRRKAFTN